MNKASPRHDKEADVPKGFKYDLPVGILTMPTSKPPHPSREERRALGQSCRDKTSRVSQGAWDPKERKFDALKLLVESQRGRVGRLLPIKYTRMAASPFGYFRGAVPVMAADLAKLPHTGLFTQICGDAHLRNLGAFAGLDGSLIFDLNDFDETIHGPWEWDVKRMAASIVLAGREASHTERGCRDAVMGFAEQYREAMMEFSRISLIDLARYQVQRHLRVSPVLSVLRKAERSTPLHNREKLTEIRNGHYRFRDNKPLQYHMARAKAAEVVESLQTYETTLPPERRHFFSQYHPADVSFRVVGTGSVGVHDYIVLMFAGSTDDPLFMQIKEEIPSAYTHYLPHSGPAMHEGQRVAEGARAMQVQSDLFLGWTSLEGRDFLVRQLRDHKAGIEDEDLKGDGLEQYGRVCGELLAKGHARSGDPCALYGYLGNSPKFDRAMAKFGIAYADQSTQDYEQLLRAVRSGQLPTMPLATVQPIYTARKGSHSTKSTKAKQATRARNPGQS